MSKYRSIVFLMIIVLMLGTLSSCQSKDNNQNNTSNVVSEQDNKNNEPENKTDNTSVEPVNNATIKSNVSKYPDKTDQPIAVYLGITLDDVDGQIDYENSSDEKQRLYLKGKYENTYYLYSNSKLIGKAVGTIEGSGLDSYWQVKFPAEFDNYEIAIIQSYNPYPRKIEPININVKLGKVVDEIDTKFSVNAKIKEILSVDLDGDGLNEYVAFFVDENKYFFAKCLVDSNYNIISFITVFKEKREDFSKIIEEFNLLNACEIIDIDNDNIMEAIVNMPSYEGVWFKVFKYDKGRFDGDFINHGSFNP